MQKNQLLNLPQMMTIWSMEKHFWAALLRTLLISGSWSQIRTCQKETASPLKKKPGTFISNLFYTVEHNKFTYCRWNINVVKSCVSGEHPDEVKLEFDTFRSDRMSRTYYLEDSEKFVKLVFERMVKNKVPENKIHYQCMKCNFKFSRTKIISSVLEENSVTCPKCDSNLIIEST